MLSAVAALQKPWKNTTISRRALSLRTRWTRASAHRARSWWPRNMLHLSIKHFYVSLFFFFADTFGHLSHNSIKTCRDSVYLSTFSDIMTKLTWFCWSLKKKNSVCDRKITENNLWSVTENNLDVNYGWTLTPTIGMEERSGNRHWSLFVGSLGQGMVFVLVNCSVGHWS